jgi:hypothetical protein
MRRGEIKVNRSVFLVPNGWRPAEEDVACASDAGMMLP